VARGLILRLALSIGVGLVVGGAIVAAMRLSSEEAGPAMREPVAIRAWLSAPAVLFGDPLRADVHVLVDRSRVDPASVRLVGGFEPFRLRSRSVTRTDSGTTTSVRYRLELLCLERTCLPKQGQPRPVRFERGFVLFGSNGRRALDWGGVEVASRLSAADRVRPSLRLADEPPSQPTFSVSPTAIAALLLGGAALLALAALGVLAYEVRRLVRRRRERDPYAGLSPLARALTLLERARTPAERRAALDRLAREVDDGEVAAEARRLAWSEPAPDAPNAAAIAARAAR
jgi:hypothetical protein